MGICPECGKYFVERDEFDNFCSSHCAWRWRRMDKQEEKGDEELMEMINEIEN